ncbi:MAG: glycosyltransferase [Bacteroidetes bacterium]|nr:glycosyltransferase [Bacteroidota bacterium]
MIFYLTYNDSPSGIYSSQVIDVVKFISKELKKDIKLIAFISLRSFLRDRKKIINELPGSIVLPMVPGVHRWGYNITSLGLLCLIKRPSLIIGRSVLATNLAMRTSVKKIVYDGRGAITAEWNEYKVVTHPALLKEIVSLENKAVNNSYFRIAVSHQLVNYWKKEFDYKQNAHSIIPCTLNQTFENLAITENNVFAIRKNLGLSDNDVVFAYSGSIAGWQSFELLYNFIKPTLDTKKNKLIFFSEENANIEKLMREFPQQVFCKKLKPAEVPHYLIAADYGLLIREESITNLVASPVKFAEYLSCGLKVIISDHLGDYSEFVKENSCGFLFNHAEKINGITIDEKLKVRSIALNHFSKLNFKDAYMKILN